MNWLEEAVKLADMAARDPEMSTREQRMECRQAAQTCALIALCYILGELSDRFEASR